MSAPTRSQAKRIEGQREERGTVSGEPRHPTLGEARLAAARQHNRQLRPGWAESHQRAAAAVADLEPHPMPRPRPERRLKPPRPYEPPDPDGLSGLLADVEGAQQALRMARGALKSERDARDHALRQIRFARERFKRVRKRAGILTTSALGDVDRAISELDGYEIELGVAGEGAE